MSDRKLPSKVGTYQPGDDEGITAITVEAGANVAYQGARSQYTYEFGSPREATDVLHIEDELHRLAWETAREQAVKHGLEVNPNEVPSHLKDETPQPKTEPDRNPEPEGSTGPQGEKLAPEPDDAGELPWQSAPRKNAEGVLRFLPTSYMNSRDFQDAAKAYLGERGWPTDQLMVWDNRTGKYALEEGNEGYNVGTVVAKRDTDLEIHVLREGNNDKIGYVKFDSDGNVVVDVKQSVSPPRGGLT